MTGKLPLATLRNKWAGCNACPLADLRTHVVIGAGSLSAKIAVIGDAPRKEEDLRSIPIAASAAEIFDRTLKRVGISESDVWFTNICACRPKHKNPERGNRRLSVKEMKACFPRLQEELDLIRPSLIVLAGNAPLLMATGKRGITKNRGWQDVKWTGAGFVTEHIYATLHPASLLHGSPEQLAYKEEMLLKDWTEIARFASGEVKKNAK